MSTRASSHIALGALLLLAHGLARASDGPPLPRISWAEAPGCGRPADLLARIAQQIGTSQGALRGKLVAFEATVTRPADRFAMRLVLATASAAGERGQGVRVFAAETCQQLVDGAVLIAALAIDPAAVRARQATARGPRGTARPQRAALRALSRVDLGVLPAPGASFGLAGALLWPALRLELELTHGLPVSHAIRDDGAGGELRLLLAGALRGCWRRPLGTRGAAARFELDLCVGGAFAWLHGWGVNIDEQRSGGALWGAALGAGALSLALTRRWWIRLEGAAGASFARASFDIEGLGPVHRPAIPVGQLGGGVEVRLF